VFITYLELIGGSLLIAGALTRYVSALLVAEMIVAIWKVHFVHGFFLNWRLQPGVGHGYEFNLVLISGLACLICTGPGVISLDRWLASKRHYKGLPQDDVIRKQAVPPVPGRRDEPSHRAL